MLLPTGIHVDYDMSMAIRVREGWTTFAAFLSFIPEAYQKAVLDDIEQELYRAGDYKDEDLKTLMRLLRKLADDPDDTKPMNSCSNCGGDIPEGTTCEKCWRSRRPVHLHRPPSLVLAFLLSECRDTVDRYSRCTMAAQSWMTVTAGGGCETAH